MIKLLTICGLILSYSAMANEESFNNEIKLPQIIFSAKQNSKIYDKQYKIEDIEKFKELINKEEDKETQKD